MYFLLVVEITADTVNYVCSFDCEKNCLGLPCENINYYASNSSLLNQHNLTLVFFPGTHWLEQDFTVTNSSFFSTKLEDEQSTEIICKNYSGLIFKNVHTLKLSGLTISNCSTLFSANQTAALIFENVVNLELDSVSVINSYGHGILAHNIYGNSTIRSCRFQFNQGSGFYHGGNMLIIYRHCPLDLAPVFMNITHTVSSDGSCINCNTTYNISLASGLSLILSCTDIHVTLYNVTMENNLNTLVNGYGGNLFIHFFNDTNFTTNHVLIQNSRFIGGSSSIGGGICTIVYTQEGAKKSSARKDCKNYLTISDSEISGNSALAGGGWLLRILDLTTDSTCPSLSVLATNIIFSDNTVTTRYNAMLISGGTSIHIVSAYTLDFWYKVKTVAITLRDVTIQRSFIKGRYYGDAKVASLYSEKFLGNFTLSNVRILNNAVSGVAIMKGHPIFRGDVVIANNTGLRGGGMSLCDSSYLELARKTTITIIGNSAKYGGGIYTEDPCMDGTPSCFYQYQYNTDCLSVNMTEVVACYRSQIIMKNNTARYTGGDIFGGSVAMCSFRRLSDPVHLRTFYSIFNVSRNAMGSLSAISSDPIKVCLCIDSQLNCSLRNFTYPSTVYPGERITQSVALVGQLDGTAAGIVSINNTLFKPITNTSKCKELEFNVNRTLHSYATVMYGISDNEYSAQKGIQYSNIVPLTVRFNFTDCPIGFEIHNGLCDCQDLIKLSFQCSIENRTIERIDFGWMGYSDKQGLIYCTTCPTDYCRPYRTSISVWEDGIDSDSQCSDYRTGVLCGRCQNNYSITMGSNVCKDCIEYKLFYALLIILGVLAFHMAIVVALFVLDISITDGTLSGLLFYANIVNSKSNLFHTYKFMSVIISWLNLDIGFSFCVFARMDMYMKSWLAFLFPPLTWLTIILLIMLSRRFERVAMILGGNSVKVLATLIELSFYQTIQSCIIALAFTAVNYQGKNRSITKSVWLFDANIDYFKGKHVPLFLMGCLFFILLLMYTGTLLCIQPLRRYSHWYCLRWINQMKPLIDAYTAPHIIKPKCQFWTGLLLLLRVLLSIYFSTHAGQRPERDLSAIIVACVLVLIVAALLGGIYKSMRLNMLNLSFFANLIFISMLSLFHFNKNHHCFGCTTKMAEAYFTTVLIIIALLTAVAVLFYYVFKKLKRLWRHKARRYTQLLDVRADRLLYSRTE